MDNAKLAIEQNNLSKYHTNHILHLILSIITFGVWFPVWVIVGLNNMWETARIEKRIMEL